MKQFIDFLRKIGLLHVSKGDYETGEYDNRADVKEEHPGRANDLIRVTPQHVQPQRARVVTFWIAVVLGLFFLLAGFGLSMGTVVMMLIIWGVVLFFLKKWAFMGTGSMIVGMIVVIIALFISLVALPSGEEGTPSESATKTTKTAGKTTTTQCEAHALTAKAEERITLAIKAFDAQTDMTKATYTVQELDELQYGYSARETDEGYYVAYELCHGEKTLSFDNLEAAEWNYKFNDDGVGLNRMSGNYSHFTSEQSDGSMSRNIEEPGTYTVYGYVSYDGATWYIAQELTFDVQ